MVRPFSPHPQPRAHSLVQVIKLYKIDESYCVKISDELTKVRRFVPPLPREASDGTSRIRGSPRR